MASVAPAREVPPQAARSATAREAFTEPAPVGARPLWLHLGRLTRKGIRPFVLAMDVAAAAVTVGLRGYSPALLEVAGLTLALLGLAGLYRSRLELSVSDDLPGLLGRAFVATAVVTTARVLLDESAPARPVVVAGALFAVLLTAFRAVTYAIVRTARSRLWVSHRTLIVGAGKVGGQLADNLLAHPEYGLRPVGFIDGDPLLPEDERPVPVIGAESHLAWLIRDLQVGVVIIAFGSLHDPDGVDVIRTCDRLECEILVVPRLFEMHGDSRSTEHIWGTPVVRLRRAAFRSWGWRGKRALDVVVSGLALLVLAPLMAAIAVSLLLEGGRGVLFRQERVGLDGHPFELVKFRTLRPLDGVESATRWSVADDERLTRVGRFLRKTSLDELPQLLNILRGQMTLVGPRPERPHFVEQFAELYPRYMARHRVPAGLTGWAQVHGLRGDTSIDDRARFDNSYIENWSWWTDVKILLRTVGSVLRGRGG